MLSLFKSKPRQSPSVLLRSSHPYFCAASVDSEVSDSVLGGLDPELSPIQIVALCADVRQVNEAEWDEVVWLWTRRPRAWLWKTLMRYQAIFGLTLAAVSLFLINRELPSQILEFWLLLVLLFALISLQEAAYGRWHADYCAAVRRAL